MLKVNRSDFHTTNACAVVSLMWQACGLDIIAGVHTEIVGVVAEEIFHVITEKNCQRNSQRKYLQSFPINCKRNSQKKNVREILQVGANRLLKLNSREII